MSRLEELFPGLTPDTYHVTSAATRRYNCVAWDAGDSSRWWWPVADATEAFWPPNIAREETLVAFREAFATLGYVACAEESQTSATEKVAIFANDQGIPLHVARQLPNGRWTSKFGELEDAEHALHDIEGDEYGKVAVVLKRPSR